MKPAKQDRETPAPATFNSVLEDWLAAVRPRLKEGSYAAYSRIVDTHLRPDLGALPPEALSAAVVGEYLAGLQGQYAPATVQTVGCVLNMALRHGGGMGYPVPRLAPIPGEARRGGRALKERERVRLERFLLAQDSSTALGTLLALYTGLRLGELCALTWGDLDREAKTLTVRRTLLRVQRPKGSTPRTALVFSTPKSDSSRRVIPIPARLLDILERQRLPDGCFLVSGTSRPADPRTVQGRFKRYLRQAGLDDINFHALRHTFATRCISQGYDAKLVSAILGHADVSMTLNRYVHPSIAGMRRCVDGLPPAGY